MASKKGPGHEWLGTISIGSVDIGVRAYSAFGNPKPPKIYKVHKYECESPIGAIPSASKGGGDFSPAEDEDEDESRGQVLAQNMCGRCFKELNPDEIGWEVTTPKDIKIRLENDDFKKMTFEKSERVEARIIDARDAMISAIGFRRAFYLFPQPASVENYWAAFAKLRDVNAMGFIPLITLKPRHTYVAVVRAMTLPPQLFGEEIEEGKVRNFLMLYALNNTDQLKDPFELPHCPATDTTLSTAAYASVKLKEFEAVLGEECVNPKTANILRAIRNARRRALNG